MSAVRCCSGVVASFAAVLLSSCAVGPNFQHPAEPDVSRYTREPLASHTSATDVAFGQSQHFVNGRDIPAEWWRLFHSPALDTLVRQALDANPSLQSTIASLRAAKEMVYAQQGKYFPLVEANYNPTSNETSAVISPVPTSGANVYNLFTAQVMVSYTFDAWGLNRRTVESLQALADSQRFQVEAAYLTLVSNVVLAAVQEASLRGQIEATEDLIRINSKMLEILRNQLKTGYENLIDVAAQEAALAQVLATLPPLRKALQQNRDLLSALLGRLPSQEPSQTFRLAELHLPADLPVTVPAKLVEQRPDVRSAEEQLHSASALIGVAVANMLPNLTVSANRGYTSTAMSDLFTAPNIFWTVAGNATQPVFDAGVLLHTERAAQATYDAAAWTYRSTVVTAFQNVADALRAIQNDADAVKAARAFVKAAKVSLDLSQQLMQTGLQNILFLLLAQSTYETATIQLVQAQAARVSDTVALFQALGGGWLNRIEPPAPELKLDVATGQSEPVGDNGNWFTVVSKGLSTRADSSAPGQQKSDIAQTQTKPPTDADKWDLARLFGVPDNRYQGTFRGEQAQAVDTTDQAGDGSKPDGGKP